MVATHVKGFDSLLATMEENLGKNLGQDIQQSSQGVMDDFEKRYNKCSDCTRMGCGLCNKRR